MNLPGPDKLKSFFDRLRSVYSRMDSAYDEAAAHYGFSCEGCTDNCCTQRFFHYTLIEYFYLMEGVKAIARERRAEAIVRAKEITDTYEEEIREGKLLSLMCPLNFGGLCSVYAFRPMICRAHGLPHIFRRPDGTHHEGGGCHRFGEETTPEVRIDRTDFYTELASLERELREELGFAGRYRRTTAQMLMDMTRHMADSLGPDPEERK